MLVDSVLMGTLLESKLLQGGIKVHVLQLVDLC
jgi:hypothetical protein